MLGNALVFVSILVAMILSIVQLPISLPPEIGYARPDWVAMVLIYWIIASPHRFGFFTAWIVGIGMDILEGGLIGQHALIYLIVTYISASLYQRLRMFSVLQQAAVILVILALSLMVDFWIESITGQSEWSLWLMLPAVTGALLWPWVFILLRHLGRRYVEI